jgi:hypothetical protein
VSFAWTSKSRAYILELRPQAKDSFFNADPYRAFIASSAKETSYSTCAVKCLTAVTPTVNTARERAIIRFRKWPSERWSLCHGEEDTELVASGEENSAACDKWRGTSRSATDRDHGQ